MKGYTKCDGCGTMIGPDPRRDFAGACLLEVVARRGPNDSASENARADVCVDCRARMVDAVPALANCLGVDLAQWRKTRKDEEINKAFELGRPGKLG